MNQKDKLIEKFNRIPEPKDFTWEELVTLLSRYGFEWTSSKRGGSHGAFVHKDDNTLEIRLYRPHPDNTVKKWMIKTVRKKLEDLEENHEKLS